MKTQRVLLALAIFLFLAAPQSVFAYVGPGSGITVIGAALAFIGAILLAIVGFIWYPIKRFWRSRVSGGAKTGKAPADSPTN